jgi:beta-glucosidase
MSFPENFVWGSAAASYQVEGAAYEDGKGLSVWDTWCRQPGKVWSDNTGDVACDHYHRYDEDARIMGEIGLKAYRFSVCWPRVIPGGIGTVNEKGLGFYDKLVDALLANNVDPWVTLFHGDYPQELVYKGTWLNRDSADWFAEYTRVIVDKLSDRVAHWMTQNEPQCIFVGGYQLGMDPPGMKLDIHDALQATHHGLLAHGKAVQVIRAHSKSAACIGAAPVGIIKMPYSNTAEDIESARTAMFSVTEKRLWNNTWYTDPIILGHYPEDGLELYKDEMPEIQPGDMETIGQPLDFYGANIYNGQYVMANEDGKPEPVKSPDGPPLTTMTWEITPESLYWGPRFLYERYKLPIMVTENGMANTDWIHLDGKVHDPQRIDFCTRYLREYHRAIEDGVEAIGYFLWSIMDNFEWSHGYQQRFGIVHVDFPSGKRTLKDSAYWYKGVIRSNGSNII